MDAAAFTTGHILLDTANFATNCIRILKLKFETRPQTEPYRIHTSPYWRLAAIFLSH